MYTIGIKKNFDTIIMRGGTRPPSRNVQSVAVLCSGLRPSLGLSHGETMSNNSTSDRNLLESLLLLGNSFRTLNNSGLIELSLMNACSAHWPPWTSALTPANAKFPTYGLQVSGSIKSACLKKCSPFRPSLGIVPWRLHDS